MSENPINYFVLKPGDKFQGKTIKEIYAASDNFIFYRQIWKKSLSFELNGINPKNYNSISSHLTEIEGLLNKTGNRKKYNYQISQAYIQCFDEFEENAILILEKLKIQINRDIVQGSKIYYLFFSIIFLLVNTSISLALFYTQIDFNTGPFREYFTVATFGSYGGFLSILYKINKLNFEDENDNKLLFFLSLSRCFISMLSSVIIFILIKSNMLLGVLNEVNNIYVFYMFSVVAGFSETFVPDLLSKMEKSTMEQ